MKISNRYKHPKFLFMAVKILMGIAHNEIFNVVVVVKNGRFFWLNVSIKAVLILILAILDGRNSKVVLKA